MKPLPCADRILEALLLQPMTIDQLTDVLCANRKTVEMAIYRMRRDSWVIPAGWQRIEGKKGSPAMLWRIG